MTKYSTRAGSGLRKICLLSVLAACAWHLLAMWAGAGDNRPAIVIDPGHGGNDPGVTGLSGTTEKSISLQLAKMLAAELKKTARVVMTRQDDSDPALTDRTAVANRHRARIFISLHSGASFSRQAAGYAVYHYLPSTRNTLGGPVESKSPRRSSETPSKWQTAQQAYQKKSEDLARMICVHLKKPYPDVECNVYGAPLMALEGAASPAVLIESGFLTNPSDEKRMTATRHQTAFVKAVKDAVRAFLKANPKR